MNKTYDYKFLFSAFGNLDLQGALDEIIEERNTLLKVVDFLFVELEKEEDFILCNPDIVQYLNALIDEKNRRILVLVDIGQEILDLMWHDFNLLNSCDEIFKEECILQ